ADDRAHPDAGMVAQLDVADDLGRLVDVDALAELRPDAFVGTEQSLLRETASLPEGVGARQPAAARRRCDRCRRGRVTDSVSAPGRMAFGEPPVPAFGCSGPNGLFCSEPSRGICALYCANRGGHSKP